MKRRKKAPAIMSNKTKNLISIILPVVTLFIIAFTLGTSPTGFVVYENKTLYRINANVTITLEDKIPASAFVRIRIGGYVLKTPLLDFLKNSKTPFEQITVDKTPYFIGSTYTVDFLSLGIIQGFEKGSHKIKTEIVDDKKVIYKHESVVEI